jgi:hypothetical protein
MSQRNAEYGMFYGHGLCVVRFLYNTAMSGTLPESLGELTKLTQLCVRIAKFSAASLEWQTLSGAIISTLSSPFSSTIDAGAHVQNCLLCTIIQLLCAHRCCIVYTLAYCVCGECACATGQHKSRALHRDMHGTALSGSIPDRVGELTKLTTLCASTLQAYCSVRLELVRGALGCCSGICKAPVFRASYHLRWSTAHR